MKKILLVFALIVAAMFTGCSKDNEKEVTHIEMRFFAYTKIKPTSPPKNVSAKFFLFDANNGEKFTEERIDVPEGIWLYSSEIDCKMITLLKNNEFELSDGARVKPILIDGRHYITIIPSLEDPNIWHRSLSNNVVDIPIGKYYIVALCRSGEPSGSGRKYSGKYVDVNESMIIDDMVVSINFPSDYDSVGFVDWITTDW